MADHYEKTLDLLDEANGLETELQAYYADGGIRKDVAADLGHRQRFALKQAEIHAALSIRQQLQDNAAQVTP